MPGTSATATGRWRRAIKLVAGNLAVLVLLLLILEGGASGVLFLRDASRTQPLAERAHTRYDPELGWVNRPGVRLPDQYGPGVPLTTNARGFRGEAEHDSLPAPGRVRIICAGDSFTLGYGVGDQDTWCAQLAGLDPRLEGVNMGQGGYGVDQAYLWYRRDGAALAHDLVIAAFIPDDFRRMEHPDFLGYAKPVLSLEHDSIRIGNVPVPRRGYGLTSWFTRNAEPLRALRVTQLLGRLSQRFVPPGDDPAPGDAASRTANARAVAAWIMADMQRVASAAGGPLVWVLLPTEYELAGRPPEELTGFLTAQAAELGVPYLDLYDDFLAVPTPERSALFLSRGDVRFPNGAGHYTAAGNALVARIIHADLVARGLLPAPGG